MPLLSRGVYAKEYRESFLERCRQRGVSNPPEEFDRFVELAKYLPESGCGASAADEWLSND